MKLVPHIAQVLGLAALANLGGLTLLQAQSSSPAGSKGTPIVFSAPPSATVSSNLNELQAPASPFREMESTLKKPFEAFNSRAEMQKPSLQVRPVTQQPQMRKKSLKETMNERAEQMFLEPDLHKGETDADIFGLNEESYDPYQKKNKTSLDRYYDRMDRMATNRAAAAKTSQESSILDELPGGNNLNSLGEAGDGFAGRDPFAQAARPLNTGNNLLPTAPRGGSYSSRSYFNQSDRTTTYQNDGRFTGFRQSAQETRIDAFKRLLHGSSQSGSGNALTPSASTTSPYRSAPVTTYSSPSTSRPAAVTAPATTGSFVDSAKFVGAPARPQGVPDYTAASLNSSVPPPAKPLPPPTFRLPERRF